MIVLALLSAVAIFIFIQRFLIIRRANKSDESFMNRIKDYIHDGKIDSAINLCRKTRSPSARMIEKGISRLGRPMWPESLPKGPLPELDQVWVQARYAARACRLHSHLEISSPSKMSVTSKWPNWKKDSRSLQPSRQARR